MDLQKKLAQEKDQVQAMLVEQESVLRLRLTTADFFPNTVVG